MSALPLELPPLPDTAALADRFRAREATSSEVLAEARAAGLDLREVARALDAVREVALYGGRLPEIGDRGEDRP